MKIVRCLIRYVAGAAKRDCSAELTSMIRGSRDEGDFDPKAAYKFRFKLNTV